jgi:hypothetical protein
MKKIALIIGISIFTLWFASTYLSNGLPDVGQVANTDLETLYKSKAQKYTDNILSNIALNKDKTQVLVVEDPFKGGRINLINLVAKTTHPVSVDTGQILRVYPANTGYIVVGTSKADDVKNSVFYVTQSGTVTNLEHIDIRNFGTDTHPVKVQNENTLDQLNKTGKLSRLSELRLIAEDRNRRNKVNNTIVGLFNDNYFIEVSDSDNWYTELRKSVTTTSIVNLTEMEIPTDPKGIYSFEVTRNESGGVATSDSSIRSLKIYIDRQLVKEYNFSLFQYQIVLIDNTLFILGMDIKYVELDTL